MTRIAFAVKNGCDDNAVTFGQEVDRIREAAEDSTANFTSHLAERIWIFGNTKEKFIHLLLELQNPSRDVELRTRPWPRQIPAGRWGGSQRRGSSAAAILGF